jgi:hypothetical protein
MTGPPSPWRVQYAAPVLGVQTIEEGLKVGFPLEQGAEPALILSLPPERTALPEALQVNVAEVIRNRALPDPVKQYSQSMGLLYTWSRMPESAFQHPSRKPTSFAPGGIVKS